MAWDSPWLDAIALHERRNSSDRDPHFTVPIKYSKIGSGAFKFDRLTSVSLHEGVTYIGDEAFMSNYLTEVDIPEGVTYIGDSSFWSNQLTSIVLPELLDDIGNTAFAYNGLTSVDLSRTKQLSEIGSAAFMSNKISGSIHIPSGVRIISEYAFANNAITDKLYIPASVGKIEEYAFGNNLIKEIEFGDGDFDIDSDAFLDNPLEEIVISNYTLNRSNISQSQFPGVNFIIKDGPAISNLSEEDTEFSSTDASKIIDAIYERYDQSYSQLHIGIKEGSFQVRDFPAIKNRNIKNIITGLSCPRTCRSTPIYGTSNVDVITGGPLHRVKIKGGAGADFFHIFSPEFREKRRSIHEGGRGAAGYMHNPGGDKIMDFDPSEGDSLLLGKDEFEFERDEIGLTIVKKISGKKTDRQIRKLSQKRLLKGMRSKNEFVYLEDSGNLFFNLNGKESGWGSGRGKSKYGGHLVTLEGAPELSMTDFTFL